MCEEPQVQRWDDERWRGHEGEPGGGGGLWGEAGRAVWALSLHGRPWACGAGRAQHFLVRKDSFDWQEVSGPSVLLA